MAAAAAATFLPHTPTPRRRLAVAVHSPTRRRLSLVFSGPPDGALSVAAAEEKADAGEEAAAAVSAPRGGGGGGKERRRVVRKAWEKLVRWSRSWRRRNRSDVVETTRKVVVLGGGSFGTAMAAQVAAKKADLEVSMLLRDDLVCRSINHSHINWLPENITATTSASDALAGADFCFHAVPFSSSFLEGISTHVDPKLPFISLSKGLELNTLRTMSQIIPQALGNPRQPYGGGIQGQKVGSCCSAAVGLTEFEDKHIKNVLAIAAGIVEGMHLGNNCMAALVAQGCSEIRWLATKMGAKPTTLSGLSGSGDIMLTCFVNLSRNRNVGLRLGSGEKLDEIMNSMNQVAEGVSTAGAVIALAQKYHVKMPVLTAVARIIDNELTPKKAVMELMNLPQVEEV
uniref:glycerol-3-phosphate dehydrogenase (NAD(+)) n=1 Tax=Oryza glumipatula TaxID=40148 RepID=A0A0D9ZV77_9ORYZ